MACCPICLHTKIRALVFGDKEQDEKLPDGTVHNLAEPERYFTAMRHQPDQSEMRRGENLTPTGNRDRPLSPDLSHGDRCQVLQIPIDNSPDSPVLASWHMTPAKLHLEKPFILYLHGVSQTRGYAHRVGLYKKLLKAGYSLLAFDYRGFADSTEITDITETTVVHDSHIALHYVRKELGQKRVLVWAHSMGSGISVHMMATADLSKFEKIQLILETPFNTMEDEVHESGCMGRILMPCFGLQNLDLEFRSTKWLGQITCPVLILHPEDDATIPTELSRNLYDEAKKAGKKDLARVTFDKQYGYGHTGLWQHDGLMDFADRFWKGNIEFDLHSVGFTQ